MTKLPSIKEQRELCEKATPGPWKYGGLIGDPGEHLRHFVRESKVNSPQIVAFSESFAVDYAGLDNDFRLIAASRTAYPALLDWAERARDVLLDGALNLESAYNHTCLSYEKNCYNCRVWKLIEELPEE